MGLCLLGFIFAWQQTLLCLFPRFMFWKLV